MLSKLPKATLDLSNSQRAPSSRLLPWIHRATARRSASGRSEPFGNRPFTGEATHPMTPASTIAE